MVELFLSHPPCGGCGLKSMKRKKPMHFCSHPPCGGCGLKYIDRLARWAESIVTLRVEGVD